MDDNFSNFVVGTFVFGAVAGFIGIALWLYESREHRDVTFYQASFDESVSGLDRNAPVKYRGVDIGRVTEIELNRDDPSRIRIVMAIATDIPMTAETTAVLSTSGITGIAYIEVDGSAPGSPRLRADGEDPYPEIRTGPSLFVRMDREISSIASSFRAASAQIVEAADRISKTLDEDNIRDVAVIIDDVKTLVHGLAAQTESFAGITAAIGQASGNLADGSAGIPAIVARIEAAAAALDSMAATVNATGAQTTRLLVDARRDLAQTSDTLLPRFEELVGELTGLARRIEDVTAQIATQPNLLLYGRRSAPPGPGE